MATNNNLPRHLQPVRLYYTGGFVKDGAMVVAAGKSFKVPPIGEYLEVPRHIANRLITRNRTPQGLSVFTDDRRFAEGVVAARLKGDVQETVEAKNYSREELLEMLAAVDAENQETNSKSRRVKAEDKEVA